MKRAILATIALVLMVGCTSWERTTFQTLAAAKAALDTAQQDYEIGTAIPHNKAAYDVITTAKIADNAAVNQMVAYEELKATGGSPTALAQAESQVDAALLQLPGILTQVKALYGGK